MAVSIATVNDLIAWYLAEPADARLQRLIKAMPLDSDKGLTDRAALRRVYKQLEKIEGARNVLLEELANDQWRFDQLELFPEDP